MSVAHEERGASSGAQRDVRGIEISREPASDPLVPHGQGTDPRHARGSLERSAGRARVERGSERPPTMLITRTTALVAVLAVATAPALALDRFYVTDPDGDKIWS